MRDQTEQTEQTFVLRVTASELVALSDALTHAILHDAHVWTPDADDLADDPSLKPHVDEHELASWHRICDQLDGLRTLIVPPGYSSAEEFHRLMRYWRKGGQSGCEPPQG